jgi:hypothetical protein
MIITLPFIIYNTEIQKLLLRRGVREWKSEKSSHIILKNQGKSVT